MCPEAGELNERPSCGYRVDMSLSRAPQDATAPPAPSDQARDEAALVEALRAGALDGLARAFDRWHQRVRVLARRLLSDDAAAEDVVQEVFAALPGAMRRFRGDSGM